MHWQDLVITLGSAMLLGSLVPMLSAQSKPPFWTSVASAAVLFGFAAVYLSLSLWFSAAVTLLSSIGWAVLAVQWKIHRRELMRP